MEFVSSILTSSCDAGHNTQGVIQTVPDGLIVSGSKVLGVIEIKTDNTGMFQLLEEMIKVSTMTRGTYPVGKCSSSNRNFKVRAHFPSRNMA